MIVRMTPAQVALYSHLYFHVKSASILGDVIQRDTTKQLVHEVRRDTNAAINACRKLEKTMDRLLGDKAHLEDDMNTILFNIVENLLDQDEERSKAFQEMYNEMAKKFNEKYGTA
jgi:hypothetical protein